MTDSLTGERLTAADVARGTCRLLWYHDYASLCEVPLADGHRADIMGISPKGEIIIVEIKVSVSDLMSDAKWHHYRAFADRFCWAVPPDLAPLLDQPRFAPESAGLVIADRHEAWLARPAQPEPLPAARRKAATLAFARLGARRALRQSDPQFNGFNQL